MTHLPILCLEGIVMGLFTPNKYPIVLDDEKRQRFQDIVDNGRHAAKKIKHAHILLLSDEDRPDGPFSDPAIADRLGLHVNTVARIRKRYVQSGEQPALDRKPRLTPPIPPKIDGRIEAHLVATCCSSPPEGHAAWTLTLLVDHLKRHGFVTSLRRETVRQALKKTRPANLA
jgi:transposase